MSAARSPDALASLYSAPHRRRAANRVATLAGAGERPQEIYTPRSIPEALRRIWPDIELDPCHGPGSIVGARRHYYVPPTILPPAKPGGKPRKVFVPGPDDTNGLELPWCPYTYCNPPFDALQDWMEKAVTEPCSEITLLVPVRPHRRWWRACRRECDATAWLNPVAFIGYGCAFPAPLALLYRGELVENFRWTIEAFDLGDVEIAR